jgi:predicted GH43/DUF377 family glycosyl hydrolase
LDAGFGLRPNPASKFPLPRIGAAGAEKNMLFTRSQHNPILLPVKDHVWESLKVYNPGIIYHKNRYHLFYRAVGRGEDWHSSIGYALSENGEKFKRFKTPLLEPELKIEKRGLEDPRITEIKNKFYLTYTAYDGTTARLVLATSDDLKNWQHRGEMLPNWDAKKAHGFTVPWDEAQQTSAAKHHWSKAGGIFPEKIKNKYWLLFGSRHLWLASSKDGIKYEPNLKPFIKPRKGKNFDNVHVEMGPPPLKTKHGWLVLYHGIDSNITYRLGFLILDLDDPTRILFRSKKPIFEPREPYEMTGIADILPGGLKALEEMGPAELSQYVTKIDKQHKMPHIIFCCGAIIVDDTLRIYYGANDTFICTATAKLNDILNVSKL